MQRPAQLSARFVDSVSRPGRYGDGRGGFGLSLLVKPMANGRLSKTWSQRIRINGRVTNLGLGSYPIVRLAKARRKALENRRAVEEGRNPRAGGGADVRGRCREGHRDPRRLLEEQRPLRGDLALLACHLRLPEDRPQAGRRDHHRGRHGHRHADLDRTGRDRQTGAPAHLGHHALGHRPRAPHRRPGQRRNRCRPPTPRRPPESPTLPAAQRGGRRRHRCPSIASVTGDQARLRVPRPHRMSQR